MRKFLVNVNGNSYEVELEEIKEEAGLSTRSQETGKSVEAAPKKEAQSPAAIGEKEAVKSPMPGNIWKILAQEGQEVKAGDLLLILEAMKMENEILAPKDGVLTSILVNEGDSVNTGDDLVIIG